MASPIAGVGVPGGLRFTRLEALGPPHVLLVACESRILAAAEVCTIMSLRSAILVLRVDRVATPRSAIQGRVVLMYAWCTPIPTASPPVILLVTLLASIAACAEVRAIL